VSGYLAVFNLIIQRGYWFAVLTGLEPNVGVMIHLRLDPASLAQHQGIVGAPTCPAVRYDGRPVFVPRADVNLCDLIRVCHWCFSFVKPDALTAHRELVKLMNCCMTLVRKN
jgi:hypothetical protein